MSKCVSFKSFLSCFPLFIHHCFIYHFQRCEIPNGAFHCKLLEHYFMDHSHSKTCAYIQPDYPPEQQPFASQYNITYWSGWHVWVCLILSIMLMAISRTFIFIYLVNWTLVLLFFNSFISIQINLVNGVIRHLSTLAAYSYLGSILFCL
jgi:hypothetical protein